MDSDAATAGEGRMRWQTARNKMNLDRISGLDQEAGYNLLKFTRYEGMDFPKWYKRILVDRARRDASGDGCRASLKP